MADVFLSYRNLPDRRVFVDRLAAILEAHGLEVWWDYGLEAGLPYREQIMSELEKAKVVVPLWCSESVSSEWVIREAGVGQSKLMPLRLQKVLPPDDFESVQAADLSDWNGSIDHPGLQRFISALAVRVGMTLQPRISLIGQMRYLPRLVPLKLLNQIEASEEPNSRKLSDTSYLLGFAAVAAALIPAISVGVAPKYETSNHLTYLLLVIVLAMFAAREFFYLGIRRKRSLLATLVAWGVCAIPCALVLVQTYDRVLDSTKNWNLAWGVALGSSALAASVFAYVLGRFLHRARG